MSYTQNVAVVHYQIPNCHRAKGRGWIMPLVVELQDGEEKSINLKCYSKLDCHCIAEAIVLYGHWDNNINELLVPVTYIGR